MAQAAVQPRLPRESSPSNLLSMSWIESKPISASGIMS